MATFQNRATLSYRNSTVTSNTVTGELLDVLSVTKVSLLDSYSVGDTLTYVVNLINSGATAQSGITLSDDLGAYTYGTLTPVPLTYVEGSLALFINGTPSPTPTVTTTSPLEITGISVPAGGNATLVYQTSVNEYAPVATGGSITNTVTLNGDTEASETVTVESAPYLGITKALSPATVADNSQLTYTFTVQNYGNTEATASDNTVISDVFDPILSDITVTYNGAAWTEGTQYTYDGTTGTFTTVAGEITVPAATFAQDPTTGAWTATPGESVLVVTGTV